MGLLATVQAAVDTAFAQAGDLVGEIWLVRQEMGAYDPATGDAAQVEVEFLFEGVIDTARRAGTFDANGAGSTGSEVEGEKLRAYLKPANEIDPEVGDVLRVGEKKLRVIDVRPVKPDGVTVLLWELGCAI